MEMNQIVDALSRAAFTMVTMVTMGGDLQPGCLADRLLTVSASHK